tara:strand:- start:1 stop:3951 length:3951 start_codon:yes stop_codon:yes gene_type:complete
MDVSKNKSEIKDGKLTIDPLLVTNEQIDDYRLQYPKSQDPGKIFTNELVSIYEKVFEKEIEKDPDFLSYPLLKSGEATIFNYIDQYKDLSVAERRALFGPSDDPIQILFSNVEPATFARPVLGEAFKTAPSIYGGLKASSYVGSKVMPPAIRSGNPYLIGGGLATTLTSFLASSFLLYEGADAIEEAVMGEDPVILPNQKALYESYRTMGGGLASIFFPHLIKETVDVGARTLAKNFIDAGEKTPFAIKATAFFESLFETMGKSAKYSPKTTAFLEGLAVPGASTAAYLAETIDPGGAGTRLGSELIGSSAGGVLLAKMLPKVLTETGGFPGAIDKISEQQQQSLFNKLQKIYERYGRETDARNLANALDDPEINALLAEAFPGVDFTVAQRADDPIFKFFEAARASKNPELDKARRVAQQKATDIFIKMIKGYEEMGDPDSLRQAAKLRTGLFEELMQFHLQRKLTPFMDAVLTLKPKDAPSQAQISSKFMELIEETMAELGDLETKLWDKLPKVEMFSPDDFTIVAEKGSPEYIEAFNAIQENLPNYMKMFDEISTDFENDSLRSEFFKNSAVQKIFRVIHDHKRSLGLEVNPPLEATQIKIISEYEEAFQKAKSISDPLYNDTKGAFRNFTDILADIDGLSPLERIERLDIIEATIKENLKEGFSPPVASYGRKILNTVQKYRELESVKLNQTNIAKARERNFSDLEITGPLSSKQLTELRSEILAASRSLYNNPETADYGRRLGLIGESILKDLETLSVKEGSAQTFVDVDKLKEFTELYNTARSFTKGKHDVIDRLVLGRLVDTTRAGKRTVSPENSIAEFIRGGPSVTISRIRQLEEFANFSTKQFKKNNVDVPENLQGNLFSTVGNLVQLHVRNLKEMAVTKKFNPKTKKVEYVVNADALAQWRDQNKDLLDVFPQLEKDTREVVRTTNMLRVFDVTQERTEKAIKNNKTLSSLLNGVSPSILLEQTMRSDVPFINVDKLFQNALRNGERTGVDEKITKDALRSTIFSLAGLRSGVENPDTMSFSTFYKTLFAPLQDGRTISLMDLAEKNGIFTKQEAYRFKLMGSQMVRVESAAAAKSLDALSDQESSVLIDLVTGIIGSAAGSTAYKTVTGGQSGPGVLTASGIAVREFRNLIKELPATKKMELVDMVFRDPKLAAMLMRKASGELKGAEGNRNLTIQYKNVTEYLTKKFFETGQPVIPYAIREAYEQDQRTEEDRPYYGYPGLPEPEPGTIERNKRLLERFKKSREINTSNLNETTKPILTSQNLPPVQPQTNTSSGPVDRNKYAALFPNDMASNLIKSGIGGLMG